MSTTYNDYDQAATAYSQLPLLGEGTIFLVFRDVPELLDRHLSVTRDEARALDYGCGAGRSTRFLKHIGIKEVYGVDASAKMVEEAKQHDPKGDYRVVNAAKTDFATDSFDLIFCSMVLVELASKDEIKAVFTEARRLLKPEGVFVAVSSSTEFFEQDNTWVSYEHNYPENVSLQSGDRAKVKLTDIDLILRNYYWTQNDISQLANQCGFGSCEIHETIGRDEDPFEWKSEAEVAPYSTFVLSSEQ